MSTFGYTSPGPNMGQSPSNQIVGSVFTCPEAASVEKVTAYLAGTYPGPEYARAAIYRHSDLALVAQSNEVQLPDATPRWYDFPLTAELAAGDYILVVLASGNYGSCGFWRDSGDADQGHYQSRSYAQGFPDWLSPSHESYKYSIYATYTPASAPPGGDPPGLAVLEGLRATDRWYPVILSSAGVGYTQAIAYYAPAGATAALVYTLDTANWREQGAGYYWLAIGGEEFTAEGGYSLRVDASAAGAFTAYVEVRDRLPSATDDDVIAILDSVGTNGVKLAPAAIGTAQFADYAVPSTALATALYTHIADRMLAAIATSQQETGSVGALLVDVRQILAGKAVINTDLNRVQYYEADDETIRLTRLVSQETGSPTIIVTFT